MANSSVTSSLNPEVWDDEFHYEYVRDSKFNPYMGTDEYSIIQVKEQLTKAKGDTVHFGLLRKLTGAGVTGSSTLEGNEEALSTYEYSVTVDQARNAVVVSVNDEQKSPIDLREAAKPALKDWMQERIRDKIIDALASPCIDGVTTYANASTAQKNAWCAANSDRLMFGKLVSNYSATFATALATIDNTDDKMTPALLSLAKRKAKATTDSQAIRPFKLKNGDEVYVCFTPSLPFRDLKENSNYQQMLRDAEVRGQDNPIFQGGDLYYDGLIIREVPEIDVVSNGTINVAPTFMCGAQAVAMAVAKRTFTRTQETDYKDKMGVAIGVIDGFGKFTYNSKQHGVLTIYTAAVADA